MERLFSSRNKPTNNEDPKATKKESKPSHCIVICIDNSGWSRDEDYTPSRWKAQQNALQLIVMGDNNNNNSYTVIATAGKRPRIVQSFTESKYEFVKSLGDVKLEEEDVEPLASLQMAQMVLRNRPNKMQNQHILWFVASPLDNLSQTDKNMLVAIAHTLKKSNISINIVNFGEINSTKEETLQTIVSETNKHKNSRLFTLCPGSNIPLEILPLICELCDQNPYAVWHSAFGESVGSYHPPASNSSTTTPVVQAEEPKSKEKDRKALEEEASIKAAAAGMPVLSLPGSGSAQCRKTVLERQRYRIISKMLSIPLSAMSLSFQDGKLVVSLPDPRDTKKLVASFYAGRMNYANPVKPSTSDSESGDSMEVEHEDETSTGKLVVPDLRKGEVSLWTTGDSMLLVQWRDLKTKKVELDVLLYPNHVSFTKVDAGNNNDETTENNSNNNNNNSTGKSSKNKSGDVYLLTISETQSYTRTKITRHFFWSQEPHNSERDKEFFFVINHQLKHYDIDPNGLFGADVEVAVGINTSGKQLLQALDLPRLLLSHALKQSMAKSRNENNNNNTNRSFMRRSIDDLRDNSESDSDEMDVADLLKTTLSIPNEDEDDALSAIRMRFGLPRSRHSSLGEVPSNSVREERSYSYGESLKAHPFPIPSSWSTTSSKTTPRRRWEPPTASNLKTSISDRTKTLREFAEWRERLRLKTANRSENGSNALDNNNNDNSFLPRNLPRPVFELPKASDKKPVSPRTDSAPELKRPSSGSLDNLLPSAKLEAATATMNAPESLLFLQPTSSTTDASSPAAPAPDSETSPPGSKKPVMVNSANIMELLKKFDSSSK